MGVVRGVQQARHQYDACVAHMIDTPPTRERFLDARLLAAIGGIAAALSALALAAFLRIDVAIDRAADDRVATALADAPVSPELLVVRAPSRTGDWMIANAVLRLDSAGARGVGLAIDLSVPVTPTGALPDLPVASPHVVIGVTQSGDSIAWPWFLSDSLRSRTNQGLGLTELLRDPDGVVRMSRGTTGGAHLFADEMAATLTGKRVAGTPSGTMRMRFASPDSAWYGVQSLTLDRVLAMPSDALRRITNARTVLLGIDDGSSVPTSVGSMPPLAVIAHDVNARIRVARSTDRTGREPSTLTRALWIFAWVLVGATAAALASLGTAALLAVIAIIAQVAIALWLIDTSGIWLPLGSAIVGLLTAMAGAEGVGLWQARRRQRLTSLLFSRFVTPVLARDAWNARHLYLQGGRPAPLQLPVTVLFVDLRGFTRFSETNAASDVMQLLSDVTAACAADIAAHRGLVDDFAGDGIKADFGVPVPRSTTVEIARDALNAVRCAQALAATITRLLPRTIGTAGTQARIGVHSGTAVAGTVGGSTRLKYTVVGDVVNVAARLQSVDLPDDGGSATSCRIVVSAATMALLGEQVPSAVDLGALMLAGREQPVHAYRLLTASTSTA